MIKFVLSLLFIFDIIVNLFLFKGTKYDQPTIELNMNCSDPYIQNNIILNNPLNYTTECYFHKYNDSYGLFILIIFSNFICILCIIRSKKHKHIYLLYPMILSTLIYVFIYPIIMNDQSLCGLDNISPIVIPMDQRYASCQVIYKYCNQDLIDKCNILDLYEIPIDYKNTNVINNFKKQLYNLSFIYIFIFFVLFYIVIYHFKRSLSLPLYSPLLRNNNKHYNRIIFIYYNIIGYFLIYFIVVKSGTKDYYRKTIIDHYNNVSNLITYTTILSFLIKIKNKYILMTYISSIIYTYITINIDLVQISLTSFRDWSYQLWIIMIIVLLLLISIIIYNVYLFKKDLKYHIIVILGFILMILLSYLISTVKLITFHIHHWQIMYFIMLISVNTNKISRIIFYIANGIFINGFAQYNNRSMINN